MPQGLAAVGPTSSAYGFPTWYSDKAGTRLEPCLDGDNPLCGFLPGDIPDATQPVAFPGNFPDEFFYFLAELDADPARRRRARCSPAAWRRRSSTRSAPASR